MNFDFQSVKLPLSPTTQTHVLNVYSQLSQMLLLSSFASYLQMTSTNSIISMLSSISPIALIACLIAFHFTDELRNYSVSKCLLLCFAMMKGFALGPLLSAAFEVDGTVVFTALVSVSLIFISLSLSVIFSPRPAGIYVTGILGSLVSISLWLSLANYFIGSSLLWNFEMWVGLAVFGCYVIYDTQMMIAKANQGSKTVLKHSFELYVDFVALFVRILLLLLKKRESNEKKKKN